MSSEQSRVYKAGKDSVSKALELFSNARKTTKRTKAERDEDKPNRSARYCGPLVGNTKNKPTALAFLPSFALTEMRTCLMKHDWINLQRLFPLLLDLSSDREALVWRYALTILLHSPMSSGAHLEEFLHACVGCQTDNLNYVLDQLITLRRDENKK